MKIRLHLTVFPVKILLFASLLAITAGCSKSKDDNSKALYYYKATIGGEQHSENVTSTNTVEAGSTIAGYTEVICMAHIGPDVPDQAHSLIITKAMLTNYLSISQEQFLAFFAPGTYPYTKMNGNGMTVTFVDKDGKFWSSENGTGDQTGSTMQIISASQDKDAGNGEYVKVKLVFNCKLYKEGTGEMKQLTSGEFVGIFGHI